MPKIYRATEVNEAVEIAQRKKEAGEYDWFRGQVRDWPPHSSLFRIYSTKDKDRINSARATLVRFRNWCGEAPGLGAV
jgi:hypothetical protein